MPNDNIARAVKRGTGEIEGASYEDITYEGYGPGGVAIIVDVLTDNRNRAVSEIRHAFSKNGGNLGESGSVAFMFHKKGLIIVEKSAADEDKLTEIVLDAGAEDLAGDGEYWEITTAPGDLLAVKDALSAAKIKTGVGRSDDDPFDLHEAGRHAGQCDDASAGDAGGPGRRPERVLQFRYGRSAGFGLMQKTGLRE